MKKTMTSHRLLRMAQALVLLAAQGVLGNTMLSAAVVYQEPHGDRVGASGARVLPYQYIGVRFNLAEPTQLTSIHTEFESLGENGSFFAALISLPSVNSLPQGSPFNPGDVIYSTRFSLSYVPAHPFEIPFPVTLNPGAYGLLFGGNTVIEGRILNYDQVAESSSFMWNTGPLPTGWVDVPEGPTWNVSLQGVVVPEPSTYVLLTIAVVALFMQRRWRKEAV